MRERREIRACRQKICKGGGVGVGGKGYVGVVERREWRKKV